MEQESLAESRLQVISRIGEFVKMVQGLQPLRGDVNYHKIDYSIGKRWAKIIKIGNQITIYCFIDLSNGDILKAESWEKPANHARGNIFAKDLGRSSVTEYGAVYLR